MTKPKEKSPTIGALLLRIQRVEKVIVQQESIIVNLRDLFARTDALQADLLRVRSFLDEWTKQHVDNLHKEPGRKLEERLQKLERTPIPFLTNPLDIKCQECRHRGGNMSWVKEGAITRVKGCPMVEANQTINFKGDRCRRFDWGKK